VNHEPPFSIPVWPPGVFADLKEFDFALFVVIGSGRDQPFDIEQWIKSGLGGILGRSSSHVYERCKDLAAGGYLDSEPRGPGAARTTYHLTEKGRDAAHDWLERGPVRLPPTDDSQVLIRYLGSRFEPKALAWKGLKFLWFDVRERLAELDYQERQLRRRNRWSDSNRLEVELSRKLLQAYDQWFDEVARTWEIRDPLDE
jgi:DNA-binding PadR family transcriptional regulator